MKKSVLQPCQTIQFLGMEKNSVDMTITLPQEKKDQIVKQCQDFQRKSSVSIGEFTQLIRRLASTATAVLPAPPQYQAMQLQQILELSVAGNYSSEIKLSDEGKTAMAGIESLLILSNGRSVIFYPPQLLIATKYAILTFTCLYPTARTIQIKIHIATLSFLVKMGGTPIQLLAQIR